jgi:5-methylthioadenosine/S-adenosylhomocysteine deaminase
VPIALGTDGVLCNDSLSLFTVMKTAALLHAGRARTQATDLLAAATVGGARACGLDDVGTLTPGGRGDVLVLDAAVSADPVGRVVYGEEARPPRHVIAGGRVVVRDGRLRTLDEAAIVAEAREAARGLLARNRDRFARAAAVAPAMLRLAARAEEVWASTRSGTDRSGSFN